MRVTGPRKARVLALVAVVLVALIGLDRLAAFVASRAVADRIQASQHLQARPAVSIGGFPFLTQVLSGEYHDVTISTARPELLQGVQIAQVTVQLRGVKISDALQGTLRTVPVRFGTATALIGYAQLSRLLGQQLGLAGGSFTLHGTSPGHAQLSGPFGLALGFAASVTGGALTVKPDQGSLQALPGSLRNVLAGALATPVVLPALPYHATLTTGTLTPAGLVLTAVAPNTTIPIR